MLAISVQTNSFIFVLPSHFFPLPLLFASQVVLCPPFCLFYLLPPLDSSVISYDLQSNVINPARLKIIQPILLADTKGNTRQIPPHLLSSICTLMNYSG